MTTHTPPSTTTATSTTTAPITTPQLEPRDRTSARLLRWALLLLGAYLLCAALGWRAHTAALVGGHTAGETLRGLLYIASHLAALVLVPILTLAALLYAGLRRLLSPRDTTQEVAPGR